jgi:hypothetical protein
MYRTYDTNVIKALNYCLSGVGAARVNSGDFVCNACVLYAKRQFKSNGSSTTIQQDTIDFSSVDQQLDNFENTGYFFFTDLMKKLKYNNEICNYF